CVGLLRISIPQILLAKWHRGELGVGTDGTQDHGLLSLVDAGGLNELDAHDGVVIEETAGVLAVGADAAYDGSQVDQDLRLVFGEEALDGVGSGEIIFGVKRNKDVAAALALELFDQVAAEEPGAAGDHDALVVKLDHVFLPSATTALRRDSAPP